MSETTTTGAINFDALRDALKTRMREKSLSFRAAADEAGMYYNTLNQIVSRERTPDADTYVKLCAWLSVSVSHFQTGSGIEKNLEGLALIDAVLYRDPNLSLEGARRLSELLHSSYRVLKAGGKE